MGKLKLTANELKRRKLEDQEEAEIRKKARSIPRTQNVALFEMRTGNQVSSSSVVFDLLEDQSMKVIPEQIIASVPEPKKKQFSKLAEELKDFEDAKPLLLDYLFSNDSHPLIGRPCACGGGQRLVCCEDCLGYEATCPECFISHHATTPTHWAKVWQEDLGFFRRQDISTLRTDYAIPFGHNGKPCPIPCASEDLAFIIVDHNGVHYTKAHFCACYGEPNRIKQLTDAQLFPSTFNAPRMAFTYTVLEQFHIHHLESKESAFDYVGSLRRLTDNVFATESSGDPYQRFAQVMRFWRVLLATKRSGQAHGIDSVMPHRQPGTLQVFCPACIDPGINTGVEVEEAPPELRHLNQVQYTADGNFHTNRYKKNCKEHDYSLFRGHSYYATEEDFTIYQDSLPKKPIPEKIECAVKAVTNQHHVVENVEESGTVNIQCPHALVNATVKADTYRRRTHLKREIGASTKPGDRIYNTGFTGGFRVKRMSVLEYGSVLPATGAAAAIATQGTRSQTRQETRNPHVRKGAARRVDIEEISDSEAKPDRKDDTGKPNGWIWNLGAMQNLTSAEVQAWSEESDRVQWFRAEAEMQRWQEEHEIVQIQFLRCIRAFRTMSNVWKQLAELNSSSPGRIAYAKKTAARFSKLEHDAMKRYAAAGYANRLDCLSESNPKSFVELVLQDRNQCDQKSGLSLLLRLPSSNQHSDQHASKSPTSCSSTSQ